jgi:hypothetical protein
MPPLKDMLASRNPDVVMPGRKLEIPPPVALPGQGTFRSTPHIRSPLPPFNAQIDTLRQFNEGNTSSPRKRVIPLPSSVGVGNAVTTVSNTTIISSSSGGGSTTPTLAARTVVATTPILSAGAISTQTITMAKSFQLIAAVANVQCEFRLYGSPGAQSNDSSRVTDAPIPAEVFNGMITDLVFDTPPYAWNFQNITGVNADDPQDTHAFLTVINTSGSSAQIQITLVFLPLES